MFKRFGSLALMAALALGATVAAAAAPDLTMHVISSVSPSDAAAGIFMASAMLGAPLAEDAGPVPMRAKFVVHSVSTNKSGDQVTSENVSFGAVAKSGAYPEDGSDEDNTYARWSPSASCSISIANPALFGKFKPGQKFYVDFTPVPDVATPAG
jgi:hypothetical protein